MSADGDVGQVGGGRSRGLKGSRGVRDEEMMLGASWYGYRPLIPHVDRVYTACGYGNKGLGMRDMGWGVLGFRD